MGWRQSSLLLGRALYQPRGLLGNDLARLARSLTGLDADPGQWGGFPLGKQ